ncbi:hypothetical protein, partial [Hungatella hathewayi]|uniref:hypothetical protein n=1 Tax=Hungatella hathewayi TaxID=154046 RepID=UPI00321B1668
RFIKVTLFLENLFHFPLDILPNCLYTILMVQDNKRHQYGGGSSQSACFYFVPVSSDLRSALHRRFS